MWYFNEVCSQTKISKPCPLLVRELVLSYVFQFKVSKDTLIILNKDNIPILLQ